MSITAKGSGDNPQGVYNPQYGKVAVYALASMFFPDNQAPSEAFWVLVSNMGLGYSISKVLGDRF